MRTSNRDCGRVGGSRRAATGWTCSTLGATVVGPDDYQSTARDIVFFAKLVDRWLQNLRRAVGWDVQYFATVETQKRGAPHLYIALRGSISHAMIRAVTAATYHQVWWPHFDLDNQVDPTADGRMPTWDHQAGTFVDPDTGQPLTAWDNALDVLDLVDDLEPAHVVRFGAQVDSKGILAGTRRPIVISAI